MENIPTYNSQSNERKKRTGREGPEREGRGGRGRGRNERQKYMKNQEHRKPALQEPKYEWKIKGPEEYNPPISFSSFKYQN